MVEKKCTKCGSEMYVTAQRAKYNNTCLNCRVRRKEEIKSAICRVSNGELIVKVAKEIGVSRQYLSRKINKK